MTSDLCRAIVLASGLLAHAASAQVQVEPAGLISFPEVAVGSAAPAQTVSVRNIGNTPVSVRDMAMPPSLGPGWEVLGAQAEYFVTSGLDGCSGTTLAPGESCTFSLGFAPHRDGRRATRFVIRNAAEYYIYETFLDGAGSAGTEARDPLNCVLDWAQKTFPGISGPQRISTATFRGRCYVHPSGPTCLASDTLAPVSGVPMVFVQSGQFNIPFTNLGPLSAWAERAACPMP